MSPKPSFPERLRISARKSDLARLQAYEVGRRIRKALPKCFLEFRFRESLGDQNQHDPLWKMPEKGVFTEDFVTDLQSGATDIVVHSWKDLPTATRDNSIICATLDRADSRDVLLLKNSLLFDDSFSKLSKNTLRIFTSSPRRMHALTLRGSKILPPKLKSSQLEFENIRGNIQTRIRKLIESSEVHGLVVAKAALDRLLGAQEWQDNLSTPAQDSFESGISILKKYLEDLFVLVLPKSLFPTAAAQGALALEIRSDRSDLEIFLKSFHAPNDFENVQMERKILSDLGGGCHEKIGVSVSSLQSHVRVDFLSEKSHPQFGKSFSGPFPTDIQSSFLGNVKYPLDLSRVWPHGDSEDLTLIRKRSLSDSEIEENGQLGLLKLWLKNNLRAKLLVIPSSSYVLNALEVNPLLKEALSRQFFWCPGEVSAEKFREAHFRVVGSSESQGIENEDIQCLLNLLRFEGLVFLKSQDSPPLDFSSKLTKKNLPIWNLPLYQLVPKSDEEIRRILNGKTHFFWKSGSEFKVASRVVPEILSSKCFHFCGPGRTFKTLNGGSDSLNLFCIEDHSQFLRLFQG